MNSSNEEKILQLLTQLVNDVSVLKSDVFGLISDVSNLKSDVSGLQSNVSSLISDVSDLKKDNIIIKDRLGILEEKVDHLMNTTVKMEFDFNNKIDTLFDAFDLNRNINYSNFDSIYNLQKELDNHRF